MSTGQALFPLGIEPGIFRAHPWKELLTTGAQTTWLFDALLIKSNVVDDRMIMSIWGDTPCGYSYRPSSGASGGLVTVWDSSRVKVWSTMSLGSILVIKGRLLLSSEEFVICNVYAPIDTTAKREVWDRQKSRMNWLQDGDANSKFFHGYMSNRRRSNAINVVNVDGVYIEGVQDIRAAVFNHFSNHYKIVGSTRPSAESLHFCQLSFSEARMILCACWSSFIVTGNCQKELILHL